MYDLPAFENAAPDAPTPTYRLCGERDRMRPGTIRATLASPISDVIKITDTPYAHREKLHHAGATWRGDLHCWMVKPGRSGWTWLIRYLVEQGVVMDVGVKVLLERTAERLQARDDMVDALVAEADDAQDRERLAAWGELMREEERLDAEAAGRWLKEDDERRYGVGFELWDEGENRGSTGEAA